MKILFSLTYYTPYISGLTLYVKRLGEALVKKRYDVTVLTMNFDKHCRSAEIVNRVRVIRADYLAKISKGFISLDWFIKNWQEVRKTDIVIINLPQFEGIIPALFAKIFSKKLISIYHCEVDLPDGLFNKFIQLGLNLANWLTLAISDMIITYTKDFADYSKILLSFRSKLKFVYPPILIPKVDKRVQKIFMDKINSGSDLKGVKGLTLIGVAARLAAEKGIEYLFDAVPQIISNIKYQISKTHIKDKKDKDTSDGGRLSLRSHDSSEVKESEIKIIIAGSLEPVGEEKYKEKILNLVKKYKDYVVFLGELKEEEMGSFYSLLDVLVLPSVNSTEAFGMVQVEAMMMGVPVVATDLPGVRIPIQKTGMGKLVPIKNSQTLAEAIVEVLLDRKKFVKDISLIKKEFSIEQTISFYDNLILHL